ncbi:MAG TPA: type II toxin-antitoxin system PemK/MazF family toxin [Tissierellia bacterium]|jgi:mRNA interferase MazF|nr:type II toxin-antitoxin system PemK/MazF family toxin [Tissierellia bacterium]
MKTIDNTANVRVQRGDIFFANLDPGVGSEQQGRRPVLVLQNNVGNKFSPTIIVAPITSYVQKNRLPTHVLITEEISGLDRDSIVLLEQIRTIDKKRLLGKIGELSKVALMRIEQAAQVSLGLKKEEEI